MYSTQSDSCSFGICGYPPFVCTIQNSKFSIHQQLKNERHITSIYLPIFSLFSLVQMFSRLNFFTSIFNCSNHHVYTYYVYVHIYILLTMANDHIMNCTIKITIQNIHNYYMVNVFKRTCVRLHSNVYSFDASCV